MPEIHLRAPSPNPSSRATLTGLPDQPGERGARVDDLVRRQRGEVLAGQRASLAPGLQALFFSRRVSVPRIVYGGVETRGGVGFSRAVELFGREQFPGLDQRRSLALMTPARRCCGLAVVVIAPEGRKRQIENGNLILAMDEECAADVIHVVAGAEVDIPERFDQLREASGVNLEPCQPQDAAEDQQVVEEARHPKTRD